MEKKIKTKEIVVVAMVAAVMGVIFTLLDYAYMPMSAVLGQVFMEITFGVYMLSPALPMYLVRKPGVAIFGSLVAAGVNLLLGSPYGIQLILAGVLEGIGIEIGYLLGGKYEGNMMNMVIGGILGGLLVFGRDVIFFGTLGNAFPVVAGIVIVRLLSATVVTIVLVKLITAALKKTGVLKGFACVK